MKKTIYFLLISLFFVACNSNSLEIDISEIDSKIKIKRYEQALFEANVDNIQNEIDSIAYNFPAFIGGDYKNPDKIKGLVEYILNPLNQILYQECIKVFADFDSTQQLIENGFKHYNYYYPNEKLPVIYTYISSLNFEEPIIIADTVIVVSLDLFLGADFKEYKTYGVPLYVSKRFDKKYLPTEIMRNFALNKYSKKLDGETLLDYMISLGKIEYFVLSMFPNTQDSLRFAFSPVQMQWCLEKEKSFWEHLSSSKMLFSKDFQEFKKYLEDRPFVSSLEKESPGRAGVWMGYNIVKEYMSRNPNITLSELMNNTNLKQIFKESKYKP